MWLWFVWNTTLRIAFVFCLECWLKNWKSYNLPFCCERSQAWHDEQLNFQCHRLFCYVDIYIRLLCPFCDGNEWQPCKLKDLKPYDIPHHIHLQLPSTTMLFFTIIYQMLVHTDRVHLGEEYIRELVYLLQLPLNIFKVGSAKCDD